MSGCLFALLAVSADAKWIKLSLEEAVNRSDLIVHGVLTNIQRSESNDTVVCRGTLQIKETLKGASTNAVVLVWSFHLQISDQTDHTPWRNMQMIWILTRTKNGEYGASHPVLVQPMSKRNDILAILKGTPNKTSEPNVAPAPQVQR